MIISMEEVEEFFKDCFTTVFSHFKKYPYTYLFLMLLLLGFSTWRD